MAQTPVASRFDFTSREPYLAPSPRLRPRVVTISALLFAPDDAAPHPALTEWLARHADHVIRVRDSDELMAISLRGRPRVVAFDARGDADELHLLRVDDVDVGDLGIGHRDARDGPGGVDQARLAWVQREDALGLGDGGGGAGRCGGTVRDAGDLTHPAGGWLLRAFVARRCRRGLLLRGRRRWQDHRRHRDCGDQRPRRARAQCPLAHSHSTRDPLRVSHHSSNLFTATAKRKPAHRPQHRAALQRRASDGYATIELSPPYR